MVVGVGALQALQGLCVALHDLRHCLRYPLLEVVPEEEEEEEELVKATLGRGWLVGERLAPPGGPVCRPRRPLAPSRPPGGGPREPSGTGR